MTMSPEKLAELRAQGDEQRAENVIRALSEQISALCACCPASTPKNWSGPFQGRLECIHCTRLVCTVHSRGVLCRDCFDALPRRAQAPLAAEAPQLQMQLTISGEAVLPKRRRRR